MVVPVAKCLEIARRQLPRVFVVGSRLVQHHGSMSLGVRGSHAVEHGKFLAGVRDLGLAKL